MASGEANDLVQSPTCPGQSQVRTLLDASSSYDPNYWSFRTKETYVFQYLEYWDKLTAPQSAGVVGNLIWESHLNQSYTNPVGIAQWLGSRVTDLRTYASNIGANASDFVTQVGFVVYELQHTHSYANKLLHQSTTVDEATAVIFTYYEAPNDQTLPNRESNAQDVLNLHAHGQL